MADVYTVAQTYSNAGAAIAGGRLGANAGASNKARHFNGKTLAAFEIDLAVNATDFSATELAADGAFKEVLQVIAETATIVGVSALRADGGANAGQVFTVLIEGDFGTDTYDGQNSETFAADLEDRIQARTAAGANNINLGSATVAALTGFPLAAFVN